MRRTGLKILYWKVTKFLTYPYKYLYSENGDFPEKGSTHFRFFVWLYTLYQEIRSQRLSKTLGFLYQTPSYISLITWWFLLRLNPNNLGDWTEKGASGTTKAEKYLVRKMINLLGGRSGEWIGYATSGATESNIFSAWVGRNYLREQIGNKKICMLLNQFTHYSIKKAADITGVETFEVLPDRTTWKPKVEAILGKIKTLNKNGYKGFLLPLTLGYTQTGVNDDYINVINALPDLEAKLGIKIFTWIDAAINGLILPFTGKDFSPLSGKKLGTYSLDFHKTGMCPVPSGLVIFRKSLKKYVTQKVQYLDQDDTTLLGTRPGASPAAMYAVIERFGKSGFTKRLALAKKNKEYFLKIVREELPEAEIVNNEDGISLAIVTKKPIPEKFAKKYGLFAKRWKYKFASKLEFLYIYKINFLPNMKFSS